MNRTYHINRFIIGLVVMLLAACSSDTLETEDIILSNNETKNDECLIPELSETSNRFLSTLVRENLKTAISFYHPKSLGEEYGVAYTFFPEYENNAIFDFPKTNGQSPFVSKLVGEYASDEDLGQLVFFVQEEHLEQVSDIEFLIEKKFVNYFACYFECIESEWKITKFGCFEDSGGPVYPEGGEYSLESKK